MEHLNKNFSSGRQSGTDFERMTDRTYEIIEIISERTAATECHFHISRTPSCK